MNENFAHIGNPSLVLIEVENYGLTLVKRVKGPITLFVEVQ